MPILLLALLLASTAAAATLQVEQSAFKPTAEGRPPGWTTWAARPEIAPRTYVDETRYRSHSGSLAISGGSNAAVYGGWHHNVAGIEPGKWYRLTAYYQAEGITDEALRIVARLDWQTAENRRAGRPDYAYKVTTGIALAEGIYGQASEQAPPRTVGTRAAAGTATVRTGGPAGPSPQTGDRSSPSAISSSSNWKQITIEAPAPEKATSSTVQLYLNNAPQATVWWDDISLEQIEKPAPREARVAVVHLRPKNTYAREASVNAFVELIDREVKQGTDIILLPEGITVVGTGKTYAEVAEPLPGPTTQALGEIARKKNAWIVAGLFEREAPAIYNTAVLIDRQGRLVGKYRKVYLPREEIEGGLTPGNDYPVFATDFGRIGMMICWDNQYTDPARALALKGAELILMPIWGGNETLAKARAIENRVFLATSGYDYPTHILDPDGETLAIAPDPAGSVAHATIDLNRRYVDEWLGDMRGRFFHELRTDVPAMHLRNGP